MIGGGGSASAAGLVIISIIVLTTITVITSFIVAIRRLNANPQMLFGTYSLTAIILYFIFRNQDTDTFFTGLLIVIYLCSGITLERYTSILVKKIISNKSTFISWCLHIIISFILTTFLIFIFANLFRLILILIS